MSTVLFAPAESVGNGITPIEFMYMWSKISAPPPDGTCELISHLGSLTWEFQSSQNRIVREEIERKTYYEGIFHMLNSTAYTFLYKQPVYKQIMLTRQEN